MRVTDQTKPDADPVEPRRLTAVPLHAQRAAGALKHDEA